MSDRSNLRLVVLAVLVFSLLGTLLARLAYLQLVSGDDYRAQAASNSTRDIVTPAVRGMVLDQQGRPLLANRISLVVSVVARGLDVYTPIKSALTIEETVELDGAE